jgi:hypothetical protein
MGEMPELVTGGEFGITGIDGSVFKAKEPSRALIKITMRGTNIKLKQPPPSS